MALTFRWQLPREYRVVDLPGHPDFIVEVEAFLFAADGSLETNARLPSYGRPREVGYPVVLRFDPFNPPADFTPFDQVTESTVIGWLEKMDAEEIAAKKVLLQLALDDAERDANPHPIATHKRFLISSPEWQDHLERLRVAAELEKVKAEEPIAPPPPQSLT